MAYQALTRGGKPWTPVFIQSINEEDCIGCGRCYKVCGFDVLTLKGMTEDGDIVELDDDDGEIEKKVMTVENAENCTGCKACSRVCGKGCQTHAPMDVAAV